MNKIRLDLDALAVESFGTSDAGVDPRGTVQGHATEQPHQSGGKPTNCLCPPTHPCLISVNDVTCVVTACNDVTCTCPPATGATCDEFSCYITLCDWTCDRVQCA